MDELLTMSNRELTRYEVMQRTKDKLLMQKEAAQVMNPSVWQINRLYQEYMIYGNLRITSNMVDKSRK